MEPRLITGLALAALAFTVLAGCSGPEPGPSHDAGPGRTASGNADLEEVELLNTRLKMAGPGPVTFDLAVPNGTRDVQFRFDSGSTYESVGLHVELSGCGSYDVLTLSGGVSGTSDERPLCAEPAPGPATLTVSAKWATFDNVLIVTGHAPQETVAGDGTA